MGGVTNTQIYNEMRERFDKVDKTLASMNTRVRQNEVVNERHEEAIGTLKENVRDLNEKTDRADRMGWFDRGLAFIMALAAGLVGAKNP